MRDGWVETTLEGIAEYINGYPFKPADLGENGLPVIRIKQLLDPNEPVDRTETDTPDRCLLRDGDIVFSWSGTLAVRIWNRGPAKLNQHLFRVVEKKGVCKGIIPLILDHAIEELEEKSHGTTMKHITKQTLLPHKVLLPPLPEQKRIIDLISSVDSYIEALQQQLESVERSRNAVLHELLTVGGDDWVETTLGQISKCAGGCAFPDAFQGNKEGIPFIKVSDMNSQDNEKYIKTSNNSVSVEVVDDLRLRIWDKGTVIFPKVGAALLTEKRRILTNKTIFDNNIMGLVPNERVLSEFLFLLMLQIRFSDHVQPGAVPSIKNSIVEAISVLLPSLDEQKRIVTIISELDSFIHCTETSMNRTKALRSGLISQLLSGEHEIPASYDKVIGAA